MRISRVFPLGRSVAAALVMALAVSVVPLTSQTVPATYDALMDAGRFAEAEVLARRTLQAVEASGGRDTAEVADAIDAVIAAYARTPIEDKSPGNALIDRSLAIREAAGSREALVRTLVLKADMMFLTGQGTVAPAITARAQALAAGLWPADNVRRLDAERAHVDALHDASRYIEAETLGLPTLAAIERVAPNSLLHGSMLQILGSVEQTLRRYDRARRHLADAVSILESHNRLSAAGLAAGSLGIVLVELGDYAEARAALDKAIALRSAFYGPAHNTLGRTLTSLADLQLLMGDIAAASASYQRAMAVQEGRAAWALPAAKYSTLLRELGRDPDRQRDLITRAMQLQPKLAAAMRGHIMGHYVDYLRATGETVHARSAAEELLQLRLKFALPYGTGSSYVQLAELAADAGDVAAARASYESGLAVLDQLAHTSPLLNRYRAGYARLLARIGDLPAAQAHALSAVDGSLELVRLALRGLPERQAVTYAAAHRRNLELLLSLLERRPSPELVTTVIDRVIRSRALVLDEMGRRQSLASATDTIARQALMSAREALSRLAVTGGESMDRAAYDDLMAAARARAERAEEAFAAVNLPFRISRADDAANRDAVLHALPSGVALISYVRYDDALAAPAAFAKASAPKPAARYAAFVSRGTSASVFVPLGDGARIDDAVAAVRAELRREAVAGGRGGRRTLASYRAAGETLRKLIWDPLSTRVAASQVWVVPDGTLHLASFAALPVGADQFLVDAGPAIHRLAAERDLLRQAATARGRGLLALGGPRFDDTAAFASLTTPRAAATTRAACGTLPSMSFAPLPSADAEAASVATLWRGAHGGEAALLTGAAASESALKTQAPGRRILHLATHGFFSTDSCEDTSRETVSGDASVLGDALLRSGLAMAGANHRTSATGADDDGILLAAEIANLDLSGVEWAVLSACDTGVGTIAAGEGVFGLQRAFRIAGAATVIMTLWPVDDRTTQDWTERLYRARLVDKKTTAEAMRAATRGALDARRQAGQSTHPFYWGGFVASGDWR